MSKYENSSIYKISCRDIEVNEIYIGSTINFTRRKHNHKTVCNNENDKDYNLNVYKYIREYGGWDNWTMIEIEKVNCSDKRELCKIERQFKDGTKYFKYPTLTELHTYLFNKEPSGQHNALNDILICLRCYFYKEYKIDLLNHLEIMKKII